MLLELAVHDLGVIDDVAIVLGPGMTALTGETGAGKTLLVEAIELLLGGKPDPVLVRPGASEARVEGRFEHAGEELVLARCLPTEGRSRAYVDGRLASAAELTDLGARLVDLHGQHAHQSLLATRVQRSALDRFGAVDLGPLGAARRRLASIDRALADLGGDERARAREIELLRFQLSELVRAGLDDPDEDALLATEEALLADAGAHRQALADARDDLAGDGGGLDALRTAAARLSGHPPSADLERRLEALSAELDDVVGELRLLGERTIDDPERLDAVQSRRRLLGDLRRKYGETLSEVMGYAAEATARLGELEAHDGRARALEQERAVAVADESAAAAAVHQARRNAAPALAGAVQRHLRALAMPRARVDVTVGEKAPGDDVTFLLAANPGDPPLPLAKVASGGELSRAMLAARLVLTEGPETLVFDEVDAGVGGEAALAVGRALAALSVAHQVLVVTHLPQVAAFADEQVGVVKGAGGGRTVARVEKLSGGARVVELSRMLSGQPDSETARDHAEELLAAAGRERPPTGRGPAAGRVG